MRTTTTAWAAALAIMSMRGPFTTAEAAPARQYEADRGRHYFPKHLRRGGYNHSSPAIESSLSSFQPDSDSTSSSSTPPPPPSTPDHTSSSAKRSRSSTQSSQAPDEDALIESLIEAGRLPETANTVVTTTLTLAYNAERTATYTLTYTETSSPVPGHYPDSVKSQSSVPLTSSSSIPVPAGTAPGSHHQPQHGPKKATISTRGTSTKNILGSIIPSAPVPLNAGDSSHPHIDSRTHRHHNATQQVQSSPYSPPSPASSSMPPTSSDAAGILGLTNSILGQGTKPAAAKRPGKTPPTSASSDAQSTESSDGLLGHLLPTESSQALPIPKIKGTGGLLGSTGGPLPLVHPKPTASTQNDTPSHPTPTSQDGGLLVGLSSAIPNILGTGKHSPGAKHTQSTDGGLLSDLGITGLPTGSLPLQSVVPSGVLPGGKKRPHAGDSSTDDGLLGHLTDGVDSLVSQATGVVGTLTDGVDSAKSQATGLVGHLTDGVDTAVSHVTGVVGTLTDGVDTALSQATGVVGHLTNGVDTALSHATGVVGPLTNGVDTALSHVTGVVGTLTNGVDTALSHATGLVGTLTKGVDSALTQATGVVGTLTKGVDSALTHATGVVGTLTKGVDSALTQATGLVGTVTQGVDTALTQATGLVGTVTGVVGTATSDINSLTKTLGMTAPTGGYTITGGGVTLTVPIPTSIATSVPITIPSQITTTTGTGNSGYTITVPTGASSILSSLSSATEAASTVPDTATAYSTSVPLTDSTSLTIGTTSSSHASNDTILPAPTSSHTATKTHTKAGATIKPTGTDSQTSMTFATSWTFAYSPLPSTKTSGLSTATEGSETSAVNGLPTYMPKLVQPPSGMPIAPANATLIQLGFNYGLNYPFVVSEPESAGQIFEYLPHGIAHGLGISPHLVKMNALMPYNTADRLRYITTLAQAYIPSQLVDTLEMSIHMPLSEIYDNPDAPVKTLMSMINPTIPILPGAAVDGASSSAWFNPAATATTGPGSGAPLGGDSGSSNHVKPSTLGIGIGAVGGAAVYAAAMVYVARRYRQKRQSHKRASSVHTTGEMSQRSGGMAGFFMSGANGINSGTGSGGRGSRTSAGSSNGRSVREQGISGPIMAENSLGWN